MKVHNEKKSNWKPVLKVYDEDGKVLGKSDIASTEYSISYLPENNTDKTLKVGDMLDLTKDKNKILPIGTKIKIHVDLKGNYANSVEGEYRIIAPGYDISKAIIRIESQPYTGEEITITEQSQFVKGKVYLKRNGGNEELILGRDIEVVAGSYRNNIQKGTAKVTFKGKEGSLYGGTKTVTFKIGQRSVMEAWKPVFALLSNIICWFCVKS